MALANTAFERPIPVVATLGQPLEATRPTAHPWRAYRAARTAIAEGCIPRATGAATALGASGTTGAVAVNGTTLPIEADLAGIADRAVTP